MDEATNNHNFCRCMQFVHCFFRTGGKWLVTNMRRGESLFDIDPDTHVSDFIIVLA